MPVESLARRDGPIVSKNIHNRKAVRVLPSFFGGDDHQSSPPALQPSNQHNAAVPIPDLRTPHSPPATVTALNRRGHSLLKRRLPSLARTAHDLAAMASNDAPQGSQRLAVPSRNPLPLSASQESQVRDIYYARVRKLCSDEIKAFADCALGRTFTVTFQCREQNRLMNSCLTRFATQAEHDAAREEWFAMRLERQRERERKARMAVAQEEFLREWWALPEEVRLSKPKPEGIESRPERVGGMPAASSSSGGR